MQSRGVRASGWEVTVSIYASIWWLTERDASWFSERVERHQTAADNIARVSQHAMLPMNLRSMKPWLDEKDGLLDTC